MATDAQQLDHQAKQQPAESAFQYSRESVPAGVPCILREAQEAERVVYHWWEAGGAAVLGAVVRVGPATSWHIKMHCCLQILYRPAALRDDVGLKQGLTDANACWGRRLISLSIVAPSVSQEEQSSFGSASGQPPVCATCPVSTMTQHLLLASFCPASCCTLSIVLALLCIGLPNCFNCIAGRNKRAERLQAGLEVVLTAVLRAVNDKKDHIPPVVSPATLTFPFDITIVGWVVIHISAYQGKRSPMLIW